MALHIQETGAGIFSGDRTGFVAAEDAEAITSDLAVDPVAKRARYGTSRRSCFNIPGGAGRAGPGLPERIRRSIGSSRTLREVFADIPCRVKTRTVASAPAASTCLPTATSQAM